MTWKKISSIHESHDDHLNHVHDPQSPAVAMYLVDQDLINEIRSRFQDEGNEHFHEGYNPEHDPEAAEDFLRHLQEDSDKQVGHMEIVGPWPGMNREENAGPPQEQIPTERVRPSQLPNVPSTTSLEELFRGLLEKREKKVRPPKSNPGKSEKPDDFDKGGWGGYL